MSLIQITMKHGRSTDEARAALELAVRERCGGVCEYP